MSHRPSPCRPSSPAPCVTLALALALLAVSGCGGSAPGPGVSDEIAGLNVLGTAYLVQQKWSESAAVLAEAVERRPHDPLLLTNLAIALNQQGDVDGAVDRLRQALEADPEHPGAHYNLGLIESRAGNFVEAAAHFEAVARHDPDDLFTQYYLASALARIERTDEAIAAYGRALERDPTHVSSLYGLGRLLLQEGRADEGARLITRSQTIRARSGLDEAVGSQYGEQGPYSMGAEYDGSALAAPAPIDVRLRPQASVRVYPGSNGVAWTAALLDPAASEPTVIVAQQASILQLSPPGRQTPLAPPAPDTREIVALEAGDLDHDGRVDLVAWLGDPAAEPVASGGTTLSLAVLVQNAEGGFDWKPIEAPAAGVRAEAGWTTLATLLLDRDHDGDLDIVWCWNGPGGADCRVATADGRLGFDVRPGAEHGIQPSSGSAGPLGLALSDLDNDRDVDILLRDGDDVTVFANQRDGTFRPLAGVEAADGLTDAVPFDIDKDGWVDLVLSGSRGVLVAHNRRGRLTAPVILATGSPPAAVNGVVVADLDNDGFVDILAGGADGATWWHNRGAAGWEPRTIQALGAASRPRLAFDGDGDGDLDVLGIGADGSVALVGNEGGDANGWIAIAPSGVGDNSRGIGTKVEVLAGALRQKFEITRPLALHAGVGTRDEVQSVRLLWPGGVLQDEIRLAARRTHAIEQLDRKGTSCPLLYAYRDGEWQFVTDFLGGSAVGSQLAPGVFNTPDSDEYVLIEDGLSPDADGRLRLRLNNQLQEVIWFDRVQLIAVDHPVGSLAYPDERLMPGPPYPDFELHVGADVRPLGAARSVETDRDVGERLAARDRRYVDDFDRLPFKGYASWHTLELDLGSIGSARRVVLLLDGWIDYADSSANVAAAQAGLSLVPPTLEVADGRGGWRALGGSIGFPAGLPKTMTVDLSGLIDPADPRVRIGTSMRIYWDRARVMLGDDTLPRRVLRLDAESAELRAGGFPRERRPTPGGPPTYDPQVVDDVGPWSAHRGRYSPYGDVTPLLGALDDRFVTTRNGDEIELRFAAPPPPAAGMRRSWLLYADGFGKDMDPNSAASDTVGPVPYHGMPHYPYDGAARPPVDQDHLGRLPRVVVDPGAGAASGAIPHALTPGGRDL